MGQRRLTFRLATTVVTVVASTAFAYIPPVDQPPPADPGAYATPASPQGAGSGRAHPTFGTMKNPDRYPSIGVAYNGLSSAAGTDTQTCALCTPSSFAQPFTQTGSWVGIDLRLPVAGWLTFSAFGEWIHLDTEAPETGIPGIPAAFGTIHGRSDVGHQSVYGVSARIYLPLWDLGQ